MNKLAAEWIMTICVISLAACVFLATRQRDELKSEAVKRGFAEWVVDAKGETTWQWKEGAK